MARIGLEEVADHSRRRGGAARHRGDGDRQGVVLAVVFNELGFPVT